MYRRRKPSWRRTIPPNSTETLWWQALLSGLLRLSACLPLPLVHGLGVGIGWLLWLVPNQPRRIAAINLALCFPAADKAARQGLLRRALVETGKALLELGPLWLWNRPRVLALVRAVKGEEALRAALAHGRGAILITPHLGAWEMAGLYYSSRYPLTTLYRPNRLGLEALIHASRGRLGARLVATTPPGVRALLQALRANEVLGILPDQDPGREAGLFVPFFGLSANTMTLVSRLAMKTGAVILLTYAERLPRGRGYKLHLEPLPKLVSEASLEVSVATLNAAVEQAVRRLPEQYLWSYKRFKRRPPGERKFY